MNSKNIIKKLRHRLDFSTEAAWGLIQFFREFQQSPHGQLFEIASMDRKEEVIDWAHGGLSISNKTPIGGQTVCLSITVNAHGFVDVRKVLSR